MSPPHNPISAYPFISNNHNHIVGGGEAWVGARVSGGVYKWLKDDSPVDTNPSVWFGSTQTGSHFCLGISLQSDVQGKFRSLHCANNKAWICGLPWMKWYLWHDRPWISTWIKSISNKMHFICQRNDSRMCIRMRRLQQNGNRESDKRSRCIKIVFRSSCKSW